MPEAPPAAPRADVATVSDAHARLPSACPLSPLSPRLRPSARGGSARLRARCRSAPTSIPSLRAARLRSSPARCSAAATPCCARRRRRSARARSTPPQLRRRLLSSQPRSAARRWCVPPAARVPHAPWLTRTATQVGLRALAAASLGSAAVAGAVVAGFNAFGITSVRLTRAPRHEMPPPHAHRLRRPKSCAPRPRLSSARHRRRRLHPPRLPLQQSGGERTMSAADNLDEASPEMALRAAGLAAAAWHSAHARGAAALSRLPGGASFILACSFLFCA